MSINIGEKSQDKDDIGVDIVSVQVSECKLRIETFDLFK